MYYNSGGGGRGAVSVMWIWFDRSCVVICADGDRRDGLESGGSAFGTG